MTSFSINFRLNANKDALIASTATFVLACIFFVMAFIVYPVVR